MTVSVVRADIGSTRQEWRPLLWLVPLMALWMELIYWQPIIQTSGVPTTLHQLTVHGLIALGLWLGLERTDLTPDQRCTSWLAVMIPYTLWFAVAWSAAINGAFRTGTAFPALLLAIWLSKRVGQVLDAMPATWLVALQLYRVFGSWALVAGLRGVLTGLRGWPAGIGDLLTGLFALPVAIAVVTGTAQGRRAAIMWNMFGLADFVVAITMGAITSPGPLQLIVPDVPSIGAAGAYPDVLSPAFVVPCGALLHALSLRQLYRRGKLATAKR